MRIDLTVREPDGRCRDVAVLAGAGTSWARIAEALGRGPLWCQGRPVDPDARVGGPGPRPGALLEVRGPGEQAAPPVARRLTVVGGPDAGRSLPMRSAPVTVGRAADCDLVLRDECVSRHHVRVVPAARGVTVHDLDSATGTRIEQRPVERGPAPLPPGAYLRIGESFLQVSDHAARPAATTAGPGGTVLVSRGAPAPPGGPAPQLQLPDEPGDPPRPGRVPWLAALVPAALGAVLAMTTHSVQFLLFAVFSPVMLLASAASDRLHHRRTSRRARRAHARLRGRAAEHVAAELRREVGARRAAHPDPATVAAVAAGPQAPLWTGRRDGPGLLCVRLGLGDLPAALEVRAGDRCRPAGTAHDVPLIADLREGPLGLAGPVTAGIARWLVGQLAAHAAPSDLEFRLLLTPAAEPRWRWARWLPHLRAPASVEPAGHARTAAELAALCRARRGPADTAPWTGPWLVLVVDDWTSLAGTPHLAELLREGPRAGITAIVLDTQHGRLPAGCATTARTVGDTGSRVEVRAGPRTVHGVADQVDEHWAETLARDLAPLREAGSPHSGVPDSCALTDLLGPAGLDPVQLCGRWRSGDSSLRTPLGVGADGPVLLDLVRDGPHALVAGTTGSGKSELLRSLVVGIAATYPPESVGFVLIDYKGGAAFADCARLPHTLGLVTDLDPQLAARALDSLDAELRRREALFAAAGAADLSDYRTRGSGTLARLMLVVDEFAELAGELPEFVSGLVGVARRGRSLGVHLVLATQRPAGVVSAEIRANAAVRIALRVTDPADSLDVLGVPDAATIASGEPGRAYLRTPGGEPVLLQAALCSGAGSVEGADDVGAAPGAEDVRVVELDQWRRPVTAAGEPGCEPPRGNGPGGLAALVDALRAAAELAGRRPGPRPWLPPLPEQLPAAALDSDNSDGERDSRVPIGLVDRPARQAQEPLVVDLARGGSLLLAGAARSGRTRGLLTLAGCAAGRLPPERLHLHVIDFAGGGLAPLAALPHCGSLALDDPATAGRLLARLAGEVRVRRAGGSARPALLVLLDGWEQFLASAQQLDAPMLVEQVVGLLQAGPSAGLTLAVAGDRGTLTTRLASAVETRLALRLTDRADYALLGIPLGAVPRELPPGRALRGPDASAVQLAHLGASPSEQDCRRALDAAARRWPPPTGPGPLVVRPLVVRPLPVAVGLAGLPRPEPGPATARVVLGVGGDAAEPITVDLLAGRARLLVAGPPGSGRSSALRTVLEQLAGAGCELLVVAPARSPLLAAARALGVPALAPEDPPPGAGPGRSAVILIDDCGTLQDRPLGDAAAHWADRRADLALVVAGGSAELAVSFRGVGAAVRAARCALLLDPGAGDGELVGLRLDRRRPGTPPGRGLLVGDPAWGEPFAHGPVPIQVAAPTALSPCVDSGGPSAGRASL